MEKAVEPQRRKVRKGKTVRFPDLRLSPVWFGILFYSYLNFFVSLRLCG